MAKPVKKILFVFSTREGLGSCVGILVGRLGARIPDCGGMFLLPFWGFLTPGGGS